MGNIPLNLHVYIVQGNNFLWSIVQLFAWFEILNIEFKIFKLKYFCHLKFFRKSLHSCGLIWNVSECYNLLIVRS